jgi:hypothetical protein
MGSNTLGFGSIRRLSATQFQIHLWELAVLVLYVAIAIVDIQDHGRREPFLIGLAAAGYAGFGLVCWVAWHGMRQLEGRLGAVLLTASYVILMGILFLTAVIAYLLLEFVYLGGSLF